MFEECVIVGAGIAGISAATALRDEGYEGRLTVLGAEPHLPYQRPALSKELLLDAANGSEGGGGWGQSSPTAAHQLHPESYYTERDIALRLSVRAARLLPQERSVLLADGGRITADRVLVATGGVARRLDVPGAELSGVLTLREMADALTIRDYLAARADVVIVGGGFIGMEVAAAAVEWGCQVTVVEADELPLLRALGPEVSEAVTATHRQRGVRVLTRTGVAGFEGGAAGAGGSPGRPDVDGASQRQERTTGVRQREHVTSVRLDDGTVLPAGLVVVGVGMRADDDLTRHSDTAPGNETGSETGGGTGGGPGSGTGGGAVPAGGAGIRTDIGGRTANPAVFAAGDVAETPTPDGRRARVEHWQHARDMGTAVARAMLGRPQLPSPVPWFWSDQGETNVQLAGRPHPDDRRTWRGSPQDGAFSVLYHRDGLVTGVTAVNRGKDVRPAMELIRHGSPVDPALLADPGTNLRRLVKSLGA